MLRSGYGKIIVFIKTTVVMSRRNEFSTTSKNPSKYFLEWKSNDKTFVYYDKETRENVKIDLPFKFLTLAEMHTVKGWHDASQSGVFANEVKFIGTEELNVRAFKGGEIAKGLYKDIKVKVKSLGGHYARSVYILVGEDIWNIQLKGSAVQAWGDFTQKTRSRLSDEWISITGANEQKKGSIKYTTPEFSFDGSLTEEEAKHADAAYDKLTAYVEAYTKKNEEAEVEVTQDIPQDVVAEEFDTDELSF